MPQCEQEGWTWTHGSRRWHYYRGLRSLCGKMMLLCHPSDGYETGNDHSPDNCAACRKKIEAKEEGGKP